MVKEKDFNKLANKLVLIEDKVSKVKSIAEILELWIQKHDYEMIPVAKMLNEKLDELDSVFRQ